ncbi:MAG: hypothetical protein ACREU1_13765 [Burkholderiales bacterium]
MLTEPAPSGAVKPEESATTNTARINRRSIASGSDRGGGRKFMKRVKALSAAGARRPSGDLSERIKALAACLKRQSPEQRNPQGPAPCE